MWLSRRRDNLLTLFIVALFLYGCVGDQPGKPFVVYEQFCDSCNFRRGELPLVDAIPTDSFVFRKPVAIEYFVLAQHPEWFDTINDPQTYSQVSNQFRYYSVLLRGYIRGMNVEVMDLQPDRTVLFFQDDKEEYIIDASRFLKEDGVIFWTPGKRPVLWNNDAASHHCSDSTFVRCYFR